ncbi:GPR endopeptidase [Pseudoflavonifractor sp. 524-17]|uniref:GPR endopeptidase n=1 Tax=Pseudoflavonifractor sp. 524-17 TaxID=2304577 RepID=UPI001379D086|nr:GPR endopeptidase [Pseudoflavonifractor sp. 524-17]NCE66199.1 GPR endopeptidase [Pseudoflavonifractor sp. 524-17]
MQDIDINGLKTSEEELHGCQVTTVHVQTEQAAKQLNRVVGSYITIETSTKLNEHMKIDEVGECLDEILDRMLQPYYGGNLCICGIGNRDIPADALGPEVTGNLPLMALTEIEGKGNFQTVSSIAPGIVLTNNINTDVIMDGVTKAVGADCVLLVDSLFSKDPSKLFQTIQLSTNGGFRQNLSGRRANWSALGIPVISLGIPMAIPLSALSSDQDLDSELFTSTKVQSVIDTAGRIIAYAILRVCWPTQSKAECFVWSGLNKNPVPYSFMLEGGDGKRGERKKITDGRAEIAI